MSSEAVSANVLYAIDSGVGQLRATVAELETALENAATWGGQQEELARSRAAQIEELTGKVQQRQEVEARHRLNLAQLDRMMLQLLEYIAEIEAQAVAAKAKSTVAALNEVAIRLRQIRGMGGTK